MEKGKVLKKEIINHQDIVLLVDTFYEKIKKNTVLGYIFNDVAQVNWVTHLPKMYAFWGSLLLGEQSYSGNPMVKHIQLSKQTPMTEKEFSEWIRVFNQTVDELFEGEKAQESKQRAGNIARLMHHKIQADR